MSASPRHRMLTAEAAKRRMARRQMWYQRARRRRLMQRMMGRVTVDFRVNVSGLLGALSEASRTLDHQVDAMRYALDGLRLTR